MPHRVRALLVSSCGLALGVSCAPSPTGAIDEETYNAFEQELVVESQPQLIDGMSVVSIQPGSFYMGSAEDCIGRNDDEDLHLVELSERFELAITEVTRSQFVEYMGYDPVELWPVDDDAILDCWDCPIQSVNWHEAAAFLNVLSETNGLETCFDCIGEDSEVYCTGVMNPYSCDGYRLPTEAEWEYAARANTDTRFAGSDDLDTVGWYRGNSNMRIQSVARKAPNEWGLYDMSGNIRELVYDWYSPRYSQEVLNPVALPGEGSRAVERGGSYAGIEAQLRVNARSHCAGDERDTHVGFRIARGLR
ncbi:MAG: SUMF1/EgtB/PvdO family nonheme iron enzyme [Myxococcota bacterium]|nr:SUMF1/EgtB/PvdO family nonheme iron enzyme [Myxococcota bacterium]